MQRMIFAACRQLGLDDDARRDLQVSVTGKASLSEMDDAELKLVVDRLKESGFKAASNPRQKHKRAPRGDLRFVHVLWRLLGEAGALKDPSRKGLNAFIRSRFGDHWNSVPADVDMLRDGDKIDQVIQALRAWGERKGVAFDPQELRR